MEKVTWTELRKAIAERMNADEKEVAAFMNAQNTNKKLSVKFEKTTL